METALGLVLWAGIIYGVVLLVRWRRRTGRETVSAQAHAAAEGGSAGARNDTGITVIANIHLDGRSLGIMRVVPDNSDNRADDDVADVRGDDRPRSITHEGRSAVVALPPGPPVRNGRGSINVAKAAVRAKR